MNNDFRKWMDITSKLYEEESTEQLDEFAPVVAAMARGAASGAARAAVSSAASGVVSGVLGSGVLGDDEEEPITEFKDVPEDDPFADEWDEDDVDSDSGMRDDHMSAPHGDLSRPGPKYVDDESELDVPAELPRIPKAKVGQAPEDVSGLIGEIDFYQTNGNSMTDKTYDIEKLMNANPDIVRRIHARVVG